MAFLHMPEAALCNAAPIAGHASLAAIRDGAACGQSGHSAVSAPSMPSCRGYDFLAWPLGSCGWRLRRTSYCSPGSVGQFSRKREFCGALRISPEEFNEIPPANMARHTLQPQMHGNGVLNQTRHPSATAGVGPNRIKGAGHIAVIRAGDSGDKMLRPKFFDIGKACLAIPVTAPTQVRCSGSHFESSEGVSLPRYTFILPSSDSVSTTKHQFRSDFSK
jgi:hypothetical protein